MNITDEEFQRRMVIYRKDFPKLNLFDPSEQEDLVLKAGENALTYNSNFCSILDNLIFMESLIRGKLPNINRN